MPRQIILVLILVLCACSPASETVTGEAETATATAADHAWQRGGMVAAANPLAVDAAAAMLERGGHAVDAAIAAHAVLGLVEPESSGLGGSGFMMVYRRGRATPVVFDGRETAPAGAQADMFMRDGKPMGFRDVWQTGVAVGVPGTVAMYAAAHAKFGKLEWAELFQPAIALARDGFEVTPKLHRWLVRLEAMVREETTPGSYRYLYPHGKPLPAGYLQQNPEYAATLARIAAEGRRAFYYGEIAQAIAARAQRAPLPGSLAVSDLNEYRVIERQAICGGFRGGRICSAPPPSSGLAQIMIANLYDQLVTEDAKRPERIQAFVDAQRLAYADRDRYIADPAFADVPGDALIDPGYLAARAAQRVAPDAHVTAGKVPASIAVCRRCAAGKNAEQPGTSHLSIIDTAGNAVSLTASVGAPFGSLRWTHGFLLNNEMSDFAMAPVVQGTPAINAVAPGKRPRSSMSPTMVFSASGELALVTGSPGGNSIVAYVAKSILGVFDWGLSVQEAADYPNVIARGDTVRVEDSDETGQAIAGELEALGYAVQKSSGENSGLHLVVVRGNSLEGAADKRREGSVARIAP